MDNLTHSLVGALIGQAGLKRRTGLAMPALIIGANLPDIDATCTLYGIESLAMRRGLTHGPAALVLLPLLLAALLHGFDRWQARRGTRPAGRPSVRFGWLYALALLACLTHPALDWLNSYGIRLLEPFASRWFYGDALFIIDIWLWAGLGFATWLSLRRERRARRGWRIPARAALAAAGAYIIANIGLSAFAADRPGLAPPYPVRRVVVANPVPLTPWRRDVIFGEGNDWQRREWSVFTGFGPVATMAAQPCAWPDIETLAAERPDLAAFLFWSRLPFVERSGDGIVFRDARFSGSPLAARFNIHVEDIACG